MRLVPLSLLSTALALSVPLAASAAESSLDDRWEVSASWFEPKVSLGLGGSIQSNDGSETFTDAGFTERSDDFSGARVEASFRMTERQRLSAGWYGIENDRSVGLTESGTFVPEGEMDPVDYSVDGRVNFDSRFELYRLNYGYDFIQTPTTTLTGLIGVYGARAKLDASSSGTAVVDGEAYDLTERAGWSETKHAPGLGLALSYRPADRWEIRAAAQGFQTSWGDFGTDGHFLHATAQVGYELTPTWTAFAGYDRFELELEDSMSGTAEFDGTTYEAVGNARARLKVHGPTLGVRARF